MDQVILLALCLDVSNSNPKDGLTREEMIPYISRVLKNPNNWMVYSTGLLERAWLEYERSHSRERAVLQIQALVDQHTTRLTITQNSIKAIEDSAPVQERIQYVYSLEFPPRYELRRGLAEKYLKLGVIRSALEIFEELEMWDEVVECYRILEKPKKAESIVRERLNIMPTPFMWCCLGDLTDDISCYESAWQLSHRKYARAKRSLGRRAFREGDLVGAMQHLQESLAVSPHDTSAWFLLGVASMRSQSWNISLRAFTRVVREDSDNAEAWGNIGAIHLHSGNYSTAFTAFQEGLKHKRHMWQMWENYVLCAVESNKFGDAIYGMHQLLDLRHKHKRPVDCEILAILVHEIVLQKTTPSSQTSHAGMDNGCEDGNNDDDSISQPCTESYTKQLAQLFGRITSTVTNEPKIWQLYAEFNDGLSRRDKALDCRLKWCRALQKSGWELQRESVQEVCKAANVLVDDYIKAGTKKSLYSCRMYIRGIVKKVTMNFADEKTLLQLQASLKKVEELEQSFETDVISEAL